MRIKKLELVGFKSFKDRTVIHFDAGITGVVGPNGCGKSNIVDALVWVMGEMSAKDLRGSQMTDVIFAGAEGYSPLGLCEVSLTLENDGGPFPAKYLRNSEIMVTRRLHRSGEGEYFVNKEPARLRDVQEIFMDTGAGAKGFSIIQQGMIGKIITAKPEDRKHLIEEAAGITKFKARKKESQRKLQATDQNLLRLQDIVGELKRQLDSLQRQAQRAERYRNLKNQAEELDLWLSSHQYAELRGSAEEAQRIFNEAQGLEFESESSTAQIQGDLQRVRLSLLEKEKDLDLLSEAHQVKQNLVKDLELEVQQLKFEIETARRNELMTGTILQEQKARQELLFRDLTQLRSQVQSLDSESQDLSKDFHEKNEVYVSAQKRIVIVDEELTTQRRELFALGQSQSSLEARVQALKAQIEDLQQRENQEELVGQELRAKRLEFEGRRKKIINELDKERQLQLDLSNDVESFEANRKILSQSLSQKKTEVDQFKDELNRVTSTLSGLENLQNNFEGFSEGVKQVMLWQKTRRQHLGPEGRVEESQEGQFRPLTELLDIPSEFEVALEAALGSKLQMLLSPQPEQAIAAVDYLKETKLGRSSFFEAEGVNFTTQLSEGPQGQAGVLGLLAEMTQVSEAQGHRIKSLLQGVAVVDSLKTALALRPSYPGWTFVTQDGDTLSSEGILTGGSSESADSGVLKRKREIKELMDLKSEWGGKLALALAALKKIETQFESLVLDFEGAKKRRVEQEIKVAELRKDSERVENEVQNASAACERIEREKRKLTEQLETQKSKLLDLEGYLLETANKKSEVESQVLVLTEELQSTRGGFDELQAQVTELQVKSAAKVQEYQGALKQLEMVTKQMEELTTQLGKMSEESEMYSTQMTESQYHLEEKKIEFEKSLRSMEDLKSQLSQGRELYEQEQARLREFESLYVEAQRAKNERQGRMNESQLKLEQARMKENYLLEQVRERYMVLLSEIYQKYLDKEGDPTQAESELKDLKEKISRIGEVNLSAIEDFEQTSKRYEFLTKQHQDLTEAKEQLRRVIDRINKICSKRFKETYDLVNDRFTKVFPVLFGGGEAQLQLHENEEKGEMGIEIIARPPGKKMQNVSLMSGGEKALTAVALVFSIFLVKPSPYCLLDEVDAPLDDANVFRFNDLVREMAKRSQIILVTHNKHTMEVAKKLYGVTMQERGVSTMVSVSI